MKEKIVELLNEYVGLSIHSPYTTSQIVDHLGKSTTIIQRTIFQEVESRYFPSVDQIEKIHYMMLKNPNNYKLSGVFESLTYWYNRTKCDSDKTIALWSMEKECDRIVNHRKAAIKENVLFLTTQFLNSLILLRRKLNLERLPCNFDEAVTVLLVNNIISLKATGMYTVVQHDGVELGVQKVLERRQEAIEEGSDVV